MTKSKAQKVSKKAQKRKIPEERVLDRLTPKVRKAKMQEFQEAIAGSPFTKKKKAQILTKPLLPVSKRTSSKAEAEHTQHCEDMIRRADKNAAQRARDSERALKKF